MVKVLSHPCSRNRVTHSGVKVKSWSRELLRELTLQELFGEKGVRDSGSGFFQSTMELQFSLLNPYLDQLVEGSNVGGFFNSPPSMAVIA